MKTKNTYLQSLLGAIAICAVAAANPQLLAAGLPLKGATYLGGSSDQYSTAAAVANGNLYVSGITMANGEDGILACWGLPLADNAAPLWNTAWPGDPGWDRFYGIAANPEGLFGIGAAYSRTTDGVGDKEHKGIVVKFPFSGPPGGGYKGATWDAQVPPNCFNSYRGWEWLQAGTSVNEGGTNFLYATGGMQPDGSCSRFCLAKVGPDGTTLWTRDDLTDYVYRHYSGGQAIAALNEFIYTAGFTDYNGATGTGMTAALRKYASDGSLQWKKTSAAGRIYNGIATLGNIIYTVGTTKGGESNGDFLIEKWSDAGTVIWSRSFDRNDGTDILNAAVMLDGRLYAVGSTTEGTAGGTDAVLLQIDADTGDLLSTTLYGGSNDDDATGITTDGTDLYVVGSTQSFGPGKQMLVLRYGLAPTIITQPVSQTVGVGSSPSFFVAAAGSVPMTYQWRLDGSDIPGATSAALTLTNAGFGLAGSYSAVVSNAYGSAVSSNAVLSFLNLKMYAGLTVAGPIGASYRLEYLPELGSTNAWQLLGNLTLPSSPYLFIDQDSPNYPHRFYRAVLVP